MRFIKIDFRQKLLSIGKKNIPFYKCLQNTLIFTGVAAVYLLIGCPFRFLFGVSCPGCGMTRAAVAALRLHWREAWYDHPMVFTMPVVAAVYALRGRLDRKFLLACSVLWATAMLLCYVLRLLSDSDIVEISLHDGALYRLAEWIKLKIENGS